MKNYSSYLFILVLLLSNSLAYPMLILKQEKKRSPAYLCVRQRKLDKDPCIPQDQERDGFDTIITVGKVVLENTSTIIKVAQTTAAMVVINVASRWVTGKNFNELARNRGYDPYESRRQKDQKKLEKEYHKDMRIKHGVMDPSFKWDERRGCFLDEHGDSHYIINSPSIEPQTDIVYTGRSLTVINNAQPHDESIISSPEMPQSNIREVDYENNPADRAWLEDFTHKICPDGGYVIGDIIIPADEDLPHHVGEVAMPMPTPPNRPNNNKDWSHTTHKILEILVDNAADHISENAMEHVIDEWKDHENKSEHSLLKHDSEPSHVVKPATHQKGPIYSSGDYKRSSYRTSNEPYNPNAPRGNNSKETKSNSSKSTSSKVESVTVKQESPIKVEYDFTKLAPSVALNVDGEKLPATGTLSSTPNIQKVYQAGSDTPTQSSTYKHRDPGYMNNTKAETNASRWARDDYYSSGSSSYGSSSSSNDNSSHQSFSSSDIGCTLYKNDDEDISKYR